MGQVAVFWDYENCAPPSNASGYSVMGEIRKVAQRYGCIKICRGYADLSELSSPRSVMLRSELQCSGLSMIDCPHNGRKNVADQMMIVDMLTFAIDNEGDGSTIILISGDRDFAYPVSILRFRMYQVVVISPTLPGAHLSLRSQASTFLDWTVMMNGLRDDKSAMDSSPPSNANIPLPPTNMGAQNNGKFNNCNVTNFRPQIKHRPETFPPTLRNDVISEREAPATSVVAVPDNTPPVYAAAANPTNDCRFRTAPPTTLPPAGNPELAPVARYVYDGLQRQMTDSIDESPPPTPLVHLPSVPPAVSPSSCQSQSDAKGPQTIPFYLRSLVRVLQKHHENGVNHPLRSTIAPELVAQDSKVYENAGVKSFWELVGLAIKETLVAYGGQGDSAWVSLHSSVVKRLRSAGNNSPPDAAIPMPPTTPASEHEASAVPITVENTPPVHAITVIDATDESASPTSPLVQSTEPTSVARYIDDGPQKQMTGPSDEPFPPPLVPTSSSQSQSDVTEVQTVPIHFRSLLRILQKYHENGNTQPLRSTIAHELVAQDSKVYENAGVTTFGELIGLAVKERLARYGGHGDTVWVSLHHNALKRLQSLEDDLPPDVAIPMPPTTPASPTNQAFAMPITTDNTPPVCAAAAAVPATNESSLPMTPPPDQNHEFTLVAGYADDGVRKQTTGPMDDPLPPPPVLTPAPPSQSSAPLPSQSRSDATVAWAIPLHLQSLVRVLQKYHENGTPQPLRSIIAAELVAQDSKVYENAGVTTFWELVRLAVKESLVWYGGQGCDVWVSLRHSAVEKLRSLVDDSLLDTTTLIPPTTPPSPRNEALAVSATIDNTPSSVHAAAAIATTAEYASPFQNPELTPVARYAYDESQNQITGPLKEPLAPPPVPAAPSPLPPNAPSSSQGQFVTPEVWTVPRHLRSLVSILQKHRERGEYQPLRSSIAAELLQQDRNVYQKAGVTKFKDFADLAFNEGLVCLGGTMGREWICLHSNSLGSLAPITMDNTPSVPAAPSPLPLSAPTSSQSQSGTPGAWTVPSHLRSLVLILQKLREGGVNQPSRSSVAVELVKQDRKVYSKAGVTKFKHFADLAVDARLVCLGGTLGDTWISLHHDVVNKLRSNPSI
ncbi:hypothetical protein PM082_012831 [Marasmius tenuissimus]|nr:hypothetical protein PM082_012831 [Marasmius tenuissimus]